MADVGAGSVVLGSGTLDVGGGLAEGSVVGGASEVDGALGVVLLDAVLLGAGREGVVRGGATRVVAGLCTGRPATSSFTTAPGTARPCVGPPVEVAPC